MVLPPGEPTAVWADGRAGRVGYRDGRVYSLPSRVLIAPALKLPGAQGAQFGNACARVYALTNDALYRLENGGDGGVGAWAKVALDLAAPGARETGMDGALLYPTERALYFFSSKGVTVKLEGEGCR